MNLVFGILGYCFFTMAAVCMAVMDGISFRGLFKGHKFWGKIGWKNKYKDYPTDQRAKFVGAKTVFVFLTDGWHLSQFFMLTFFALSAVDFDRSIQHIAIEFIVLRILFSAIFTFLFDYLFTKKITL